VWLQINLQTELSLDELACRPRILSALLNRWGHSLYKEGSPYYLFAEGINRIVDYHRHLKGQLTEAWDAARVWMDLHPPQHRPPIPFLVLRAMMAVALWKGWIFFAAVISLCFEATLRLADILQAQKIHLMITTTHRCQRRSLFLKVQEPKSRRRGARSQHAATTHAETIDLWEALVTLLQPMEMLYPFSQGTFRKQWQSIVRELGLQAYALTPACMRGGGAVQRYLEGHSIADIQWQMRIKDQTTLRHYLQEVVVDEILAQLPVNTFKKLQFFESVSSKLVQEALHKLKFQKQSC